ncbi:MAG: fructose 1,6-bisphosphatase [Deltaproteobacteria bacterium]|nr:fructose 1,6-bisphosphatase [Deltaproteobacteria bacterium]
MENFEFKLDGPVFREGVPIHLVIKAWDNFQSVVDKTYLTMTESQRISAKDREAFFLRASQFERGSFLTKFEIVISGVQFAMPFISTLGPQNLWEYTKETFNFLKLICSLKSTEDKPRVEISNSQQVSFQIGDNHYQFNGPIYQIAEKALPAYQDLAHMLEPGKLEYISAGSGINPEIVLRADVKFDDRKLFDLPTKLQNEPVELQCEIFDFNKFKNIGKLRIRADQPIPAGDYSFSIFGNQNNVNYIYSMLKPAVSIKCLIESVVNPLGPNFISRLHVTGVTN